MMINISLGHARVVSEQVLEIWEVWGMKILSLDLTLQSCMLLNKNKNYLAASVYFKQCWSGDITTKDSYLSQCAFFQINHVSNEIVHIIVYKLTYRFM